MISRIQQNAEKVLKLTKQFHRELHLTRKLQFSPNDVTEVRIPVPWGHIAGKWWGNTNEQPIFALHGWQDNANSFDALLELWPSSKPVLAIDTPGHGFSSHFPAGMMYHNANNVMVCRRVQKYFKWNDKITIMGHSQGGIIAFLFAAIYPEYVGTLIGLDAPKPFSPDPLHFEELGGNLDKVIDICRREMDANPKYSLEEIEERWLKAIRGSVTREALKILMKRAVQYDEMSGKYSLTRDQKLKMITLYRLSEDQCLELARNLNCHYLLIKFSKGEFVEDALKKAPHFIKTVTESARSFKCVTLEGTHYTHLTNPKIVVPVITEFLNTIES